MRTKEEILELLRDDEEYYNGIGTEYLSNSNISAILRDPDAFISKEGDEEEKAKMKKSSALLVGGYFHTVVLEPSKVKNYKILDFDKRTLKAYKEALGDNDILLLQKEADMVHAMRDKLMANSKCKEFITEGNVEYEVPNIGKINGLMWKGKADILNHDKKLIIDLKSTANLGKFKHAAKMYNYDSQAYIYTQLFPGYDFLFIVVDKATLQLGIYDTSQYFMNDGQSKVAEACNIYRNVTSPDYDGKQSITNETL